MNREWKPGDVAMVTCRGDEPARMIRDAENTGWHDDEGTFYWDKAAGHWTLDEVRPLVVIDPEDREQVRAFTQVWSRQDHGPFLADLTTDMQAALREFANPTPEEPTGLYARIEDDKGRIWVRTAEQSSVWRRECKNSDGRRYLIPQDGAELYREIAVVRVLSEGVTP